MMNMISVLPAIQSFVASLPVSPIRFLIKGTALNKGKARVWIERRDLALYGFSRGAAITVDMSWPGTIAIRLDAAGKRKVAGRDTAKGEVQILDICFAAADRDAMFNGAAQLSVTVSYGLITVVAA
jgi:hypothetical protein